MMSEPCSHTALSSDRGRRGFRVQPKRPPNWVAGAVHGISCAPRRFPGLCSDPLASRAAYKRPLPPPRLPSGRLSRGFRTDRLGLGHQKIAERGIVRTGVPGVFFPSDRGRRDCPGMAVSGKSRAKRRIGQGLRARKNDWHALGASPRGMPGYNPGVMERNSCQARHAALRKGMALVAENCGELRGLL